MIQFKDLEEEDLFVLAGPGDEKALYRKEGETSARAYNRNAGIRHGAIQLYPQIHETLDVAPDQEVYKISLQDERG